MEVHISLDGAGDRTDRIYRQLQDAIIDGRLRPGERLPPTRELAQRLSVSRSTVSVAYDRLTAEGFLVGRVGAGTYVSPAAERPPHRRSAPSGTAAVRPRSVWGSVARFAAPSGVGALYDFRVGVPDVSLFPLDVWRRLVNHELTRTGIGRGEYVGPGGQPVLTDAIARHVGVSRSVRAASSDVLITHGAQQALDLVARVLVEPGDQVAVEEPGYPPAYQLFRTHGARVVGVPVDAEGLEVARLPASTRIVYTTPSHQFPLGMSMSLGRRRALLEWAEAREAVIIEDDYDSEFRFAHRPLEPLQSLDRSGRVIYVGTFAKTMLPALRMGFLVAPASLQAALRMAKQLTDWHGDPTLQRALARFINDGGLARHVRRANRVYAGRHEQIVTTLQREAADLLDVVPSVAGLHVCARVRELRPLDLGAAITAAEARGVRVIRLADYCQVPPDPDGIVLGYGMISDERVGPGLGELITCLRAASP
jgi:GntR family transcriptional regulator/MocR family aminotransferase